MILEQAAILMARLAVSFPASNLSQETNQEWLRFLVALPEDKAEKAVKTLIYTWDSPFLPPIARFLSCCGVHADAVHQLDEAITLGKELVVDLASGTGWSVGVARLPLPALTDA